VVERCVGVLNKWSQHTMSLDTYDEENIFAKLIDGKMPCFKVYETKTSLAFLDAFPQAEGHTLIVPKEKGSTSFPSWKFDRQTSFFRDLQKVANAVQKAFNADGVRVITNHGKASGQTVFHTHFHIIPFYSNVVFDGKPASEMMTAEVATPLVSKLQSALQPPPKPLKKPKFGKVSDLTPESKGHNLRVKLVEAPTPVERQGKTFYQAKCGDSSGCVVLSLSAEQMETCKEGETFEVRNGRVIMVKGTVRLGVDKWGKIEVSEEKIDDVNTGKDVSSVEYELVA